MLLHFYTKCECIFASLEVLSLSIVLFATIVVQPYVITFSQFYDFIPKSVLLRRLTQLQSHSIQSNSEANNTNFTEAWIFVPFLCLNTFTVMFWASSVVILHLHLVLVSPQKHIRCLYFQSTNNITASSKSNTHMYMYAYTHPHTHTKMASIPLSDWKT